MTFATKSCFAFFPLAVLHVRTRRLIVCDMIILNVLIIKKVLKSFTSYKTLFILDLVKSLEVWIRDSRTSLKAWFNPITWGEEVIFDPPLMCFFLKTWKWLTLNAKTSSLCQLHRVEDSQTAGSSKNHIWLITFLLNKLQGKNLYILESP